MEKVKLEVSQRPDVIIQYSGKNISVNPVIKISEQKEMRDVYLVSMFNKGETNESDESFAEYMLRREILKVKVGIDVDSETLDNIDELVWGDFYEKVVSNIVNYKEFRNILSLSLENKLKLISLKNSSGYLMKGLFEKVNPIINTFSEMAQGDLDSLKKTMLEIVEEIKKEPIASVVRESSIEEKLHEEKPQATKRKRKG